MRSRRTGAIIVGGVVWAIGSYLVLFAEPLPTRAIGIVLFTTGLMLPLRVHVIAVKKSQTNNTGPTDE